MDIEITEKQAIEAALSANWELAIKINKKILDNGTITPGVYNRLGKAFSELNNWKEALECFKKALELDPINSVAEKGFENAKNKRNVGLTSADAHKETLIEDPSTSLIIELHLNSPKIEETYFLVPSKKPLYFLLVRESDGKKIKRISRSRLNLKQHANPEKMEAKIIEIVKDHIVKLKLIAQSSVFKTEKQQIDPSLNLKRKHVLEEKKEIQKMFEDERSDEVA